MKTIGIQIKAQEAIIVVLEKDSLGNIIQTNESRKFDITDHTNHTQIKQFQEQINTAFDSIGAQRIGIILRNSSGNFAGSPISFKLEGIIQLYNKVSIELVSDKTIEAYFKRNPKISTLKPNYQYQNNAFDLAYYLTKTL